MAGSVVRHRRMGYRGQWRLVTSGLRVGLGLALLFGLFPIAGTVPVAQAAPVARSASGADAASIQAAVDQFRADLGGANNSIGGTTTGGRREINWDGTPDTFSAPNNLPADFFNVNSPRGVVFSTPART